jgi:cytochrome c oxidase assembly factor CtaG
MAVPIYGLRWRAVRREGTLAAARGAGTWRLISFGAGLACIVAALISPIDALGDQLFVMHMTQHMLLLDLAPIFLTLGLTRVLMRPITRRVQWLERSAGPLAHPVFAVALYCATIWIWHVPALYDAALRHPVLHAVEHLCFVAAGLLFWWHLLSPILSRSRLTGLPAVGYVVGTKLLVGALGMIITFAPHIIYTYYAHQPSHWGMSPIADQNVSGAIMTVEQESVLGIMLMTMFIRMLSESDRAEDRVERFGAG